jgi:hypothetical protein
LSGVLTTDKTIMLGGDTTKTYTITLHVQGEVEAKQYNGTDQNQAGPVTAKLDGFAKGGSPVTTDNYNVYMIRVTAPKADYFLNSLLPPGESNHTTYTIDYVAKIQAQGGTTVRLVAADSNCQMIKNCGPVHNGATCPTPLIVPNIEAKAVAANPTFKFDKAYDGQWVVWTVTDVTQP